jgi:hypothetical protein
MGTAKKAAVAPQTTAAPRPKVEAKSNAAEVKNYRVTSNLHIDGLKLGPGDEVELTDHQAAGLSDFVEFKTDEPEAPTE